jgi:hypothetical protein
MSGIGANSAILVKALNDLMTQFEQTGAAWRDQARTEFDREYLAEISASLRTASRAAQEIEEILRHVMKECS